MEVSTIMGITAVKIQSTQPQPLHLRVGTMTFLVGKFNPKRIEKLKK